MPAPSTVAAAVGPGQRGGRRRGGSPVPRPPRSRPPRSCSGCRAGGGIGGGAAVEVGSVHAADPKPRQWAHSRSHPCPEGRVCSVASRSGLDLAGAWVTVVLGAARRARSDASAGYGLESGWQGRGGYRSQFRTGGYPRVLGRVEVHLRAWRAEYWRGRLGRCRTADRGRPLVEPRRDERSGLGVGPGELADERARLAAPLCLGSPRGADHQPPRMRVPTPPTRKTGPSIVDSVTERSSIRCTLDLTV